VVAQVGRSTKDDPVSATQARYTVLNARVTLSPTIPHPAAPAPEEQHWLVRVDTWTGTTWKWSPGNAVNSNNWTTTGWEKITEPSGRFFSAEQTK